jgi:polyhydroxyalkanoate synthesis regulator phasin
MVDDLRNYLQMAAGLTEATTSKAKDVVAVLLSQGMSLSSRAMPAPEMMGQVQELADNLVTTSKDNREALVGMIRTEVDRAVGRMGFVREDELAALRRHVERLETQLADVRAAASSPHTPPATWPSGSDPERESESESGPSSGTTTGPVAEDLPVKKKKKKRIVVTPEADSSP